MRARLALLAGAAVLLAGCSSLQSQVDALAPVGGGDITTLRIAVIDVLTNEGVAMAQVPVCVDAGTQYTCAGTTAEGRPIEATAPLTEPLTVTVKVDGATLYEGLASDVINAAAGDGS